MKTIKCSLICSDYYWPDPKPEIREVLEDENEFWEIVDNLDYPKFYKNQEEIIKRLQKRFTKKEIKILHYTRAMFEFTLYKVYTADTDVLKIKEHPDFRTGGDTFVDFVNLVISMGKKVYYRALHDREYGKKVYFEHYPDIPESFAYTFMEFED